MTSHLKDDNPIQKALNQALDDPTFSAAITSNTKPEASSLCLADTDHYAGLAYLVVAASENIQKTQPKSKTWVLFEQNRQTQQLASELRFWGKQTSILTNAVQEANTSSIDDPETYADQIHTLTQIHNNQSEIILLTSLDIPCPSPKQLSSSSCEVSIGDHYEPESLISMLDQAGFEKMDHIHNRGQYAQRGGIIDIYTWQASYPLRIEFFDTEIDSLREFDLNTQTSIRKIKSSKLQLTDHTVDSTIKSQISQDDLIITCGETDSITDEYHHLHIGSNPLSSIAIQPSPLGAFEAGDFVLQQNKRHAFTQQLAEWGSLDWQIHLVFANHGEIERFKELMGDSILDNILVSVGELSRGFTIAELQLAVLSSAELFGRYQTNTHRRHSHQELQQRARAQTDIIDIQKGDLVVHTEYGIGRFQDITKEDDDSEEINIRFRDGAILSVPIDQAHLLNKYVGLGGKEPTLTKLGDTKWSRSRKQAEKSIMDYAAQLLKLQAERQVSKGKGHPPDTKWMWEFESSFRYTETPDQLTAIEDAKADMECSKPMDRLICGDVGFGKTEVAIRAAFKAVTGGKQAALLVPTTVLAEQHWRTLRERMSDYPVRIELLNRFRKPAEIRETLKGLADGSVDIVIGTHRLVSADVNFHNLGVAIIDEEQRFGVKHKEKFKELFAGIDVLTLSATPIPRTLYLSLMGTRDMSTIDTAPPNKVPVQTSICGYDERIIRSSITRELDRGGQVFFLHNRVKTIEIMRDKIQNLVPNANIVIGHGQMEKDELEQVMRTFVDGKADILLATTIIESGIDIPNANTIIIDRADRFGLADLYQLRGRVGRGGQNAYAILLIPKDLTVGGDATKRINAIKQYTALGSGFKIAMRDLEIRGAGNLLGTKQSGHISSVGFDLYCQLLRQSIERLKGNKQSIRIDVTLRADFLNFTETSSSLSENNNLNVYIPVSYMTEPTMRIRAYKQLAEAAAEKTITALKHNWRDQYGKIPTPALNLLQVTLLKLAAAKANITSIEIKGQRLMLTRNNQYIMLSQSKFPRLTETTNQGKLKQTLQMLRDI